VLFEQQKKKLEKKKAETNQENIINMRNMALKELLASSSALATVTTREVVAVRIIHKPSSWLIHVYTCAYISTSSRKYIAHFQDEKQMELEEGVLLKPTNTCISRGVFLPTFDFFFSQTFL
jgi:hypothetical protein